MTALRLAVAAAEELPAVVKAVAKEIPPLAQRLRNIPASEVVDLVATSKPALREVKNVVSGNGISLNGVLKNGVKAIKDHPFQTAVWVATAGSIAYDISRQSENEWNINTLQKTIDANKEAYIAESGATWRETMRELETLKWRLAVLEWYPRFWNAANDSAIMPDNVKTLLSSVEDGGNIPENGRNTPDYNTLLKKFNSTFPGFKLTFGQDSMPIMDLNAIKKYASESDGMIVARDVWLDIKALIASYPAHIPTPTANRRATATV